MLPTASPLCDFPVLPIPTPHGQNSRTFHPPPLDGSLSISEIFEFHAEHSPKHPVFTYADGPDDARTILYPEAWRLVKRASKIIHSHISRFEEQYSRQDRGGPQNPPTVGILANADTISFFSTIVGTMRLGLLAFPLSIRNSAISIAHLIKKTHVLQLFVSPDPAMQSLCAEALDILKDDGIQVKVLPMILFDDIRDDAPRASELDQFELALPKINLDTSSIIFHSSGSTSFPKPIYITHRRLLQWSLVPLFGEVDLCGAVLAAPTLGLFHVMGIVFVIWTSVPGMILGVFKPASPPVIPLPETALNNIMQIKSTYILTVPSFIEAWARDPTMLSQLKSMVGSLRGIAYSGAPLTKSLGDDLVRSGVNLCPLFGLTETWCVALCLPSKQKDLETWEWFEPSPLAELEFIPQEGSEDLFEICIVETPYSGPALTNATSRDGRPMYRTSDLCQRHPTYPNKWRVHGRSDDQIMLSTGEKTNPGPLETILIQDTHVKAAVMFGRGQFQNGILIDPKPEYSFDPVDEAKLVEFRNLIWSSIEKMNAFAPAHSRLFKEMIIVASPSKPFEYTSKGTPRRHFMTARYDQEIQALYDTVRESAQIDAPVPEVWTEESVLQFVAEVVRKVMKRNVPADADIFQQGCDSLQATYIRNIIVQALRQPLSTSSLRLSSNFIYSNPTINALSSFIGSLFSPDDVTIGLASESDVVAEMEAMVEKYSVDFPVHRGVERDGANSVDEVVLLTGTTGRLGSHLLAQLLAKPSVTKVYALNRAAKGSIAGRQHDAFVHWGLDEALLSGEKLVLAKADFSKSDLGIGEDLYSEVRDSVTSIIHNAWRVDFNVALSSFEPLVAGVRRLINLSLSSPRPSAPPILFTSSISVIINSPTSPILELPVTDPKIAAGRGYSASKWVAETMLLRAMSERGLRTNVVRVGQLSGDLVKGGWNEKEWVPVLLKGSQALGAVPQRVEELSWVPVDVAASTLLEMLGSTEPVLHLVHPHPVPWTVISSTSSTLLNIPIVPYDQWLSMLKDAARDTQSDSDAVKHNPALLLLEFFEKDLPAETGLVIDTGKAVVVSETLRDARKMEGGDVERWIGYWAEKSFLSGSV